MRRNIIGTLVSKAFRSFSGSLPSRRGNATPARRHRRTLAFEALETRLLLSADPVGVVDGTLVITGTEGNDTVVVRQVEQSTISVELNGQTFDFASSDVSNIVAVLRGGDDTLENFPAPVPLTVDGGDGSDILTVNGTDDADLFSVSGATVGLSGAGVLSYAGFEALTVDGGEDDEIALDNHDGGLDKPVVQFRFGTVFTTKIDWSGPGDEGPEESITVVYGKRGVVHIKQADSGGETGDVPTAYDISGDDESGSVDVKADTSGKPGFHLESTGLESLTITAGGGDDSVNVHGNIPAALLVSGEGGDDKFELITTDVGEAIEFLGEPDPEVPDPRIRVTDKTTGQITFDALVVGFESIGVDAAGGNDQVTMSDADGPLAGIEFAIELGEGDDSLDATIRSTLPSDPPASDTIFYVLDISGSLGSDAVTFTGLDGNPTADSFFDVFVDLGEGDNLFEADLLNPAGLLSVVGGAGNDKVTARAQWSDSAPDQVVDFSALFQSGAGNDQVDIEHIVGPVSGQVGSFFDIFTEVDLGGGMDTSSVYAALRWLAQLAVNIVDYIDEDEIATPFNAMIAAQVEGGTLDLSAHSESIGKLSGIDFRLDAHAMAPQSSLDLSVMGSDAADAVALDLSGGAFEEIDTLIATGEGDDAIRHKMFAIVDRTNVNTQTGGGNDSVAFDWRVPLDREIVSPIELLAVTDLGDGDDSLTQNFAVGQPAELGGEFVNGHSFQIISAGKGNDMLDIVDDTAGLFDLSLEADLGAGDDSTHIESLLGDHPSDSIYRVRDDEGDAKAQIVFGDGETGRRLPTGETQIMVEYRFGAGNDTLVIDWLAHLEQDFRVDLDAATGAGDDRVTATWDKQPQFRPGKIAQWDYNFELGAGNDAFNGVLGDPTDTDGGLPGRLDLDISGGADSDAIALLVPAVQKVRDAAARIDGGAGGDTIGVVLLPGDPTLSEGSIELDIASGGGDDTVDVNVTGGGTSSAGGPHVKVFDGETGAETQSFLAYAPTFTGGVRVATGDITGDGVADIITGAGPGAGPHVKVFDGQTNAEIRSFFAYAPTFTGGVFVAAGDVNGDGRADIITGADAGGAPHVKVFDGASGAELRSFFAYSPSFAGGVRVAAGDVNGDRRADIITGAGPGAGPHVKVFDGQSLTVLQSFFAYGTFTGGVFVAAGDVNEDGFADIITGADAGAGPHVKVFDGLTGTEASSFFAYASAFTGGVRVAAGDVNEDGVADIITGAGPGAGPHVKVFDGQSLAELQSFLAYGAFTGGVFVAAGDVNGDGMADIVTGADRQAAFKLALDTAGGNDTVAASFFDVFAVQDVAIDLGTGADSVALDWRGALRNPGPVQASVQIDLGGADAFLPEVGDEVLVAFDNGDPNQPLVLGMVWNSQDVPLEDDPKSLRLEWVKDADPGVPAALELEISGGGGSDAIALLVPAVQKVRVAASVDGGAGNDTIDVVVVAPEDPDAPAEMIELDLSGGAGNDAIALLVPAVQKVRAAAARIDGGDGNDTIDVTFEPSAEPDQPAGMIELDITGGAGNDAIALLVPAVQKIRNVHIDGGNGADWILVAGDVDTHIEGGNGADWITVIGNGNNNINGGNGPDWITVIGNGNNNINGGNGPDRITVIGNGDNPIDGGRGPDWIFISGGAVTTIPDCPRLVRSDLWTPKAGRDGKPNGAKP